MNETDMPEDELTDEERAEAEERAWNRYVEDFYGGSGPLPLLEQQIAARKLK